LAYQQTPTASSEENAGEKKASFAKNVGYVGFATFLSRIFGLLREQTFAGLFGAGSMTDAFNAAFRIPNLLRDLFAEGALSSAFVPTFTEYHKTRTAEETDRLANTVISALITILAIICLFGIFYTDDIIKYIAPGFENTPGKTAVTITMTKIMFPFLILVAVAAVFMGMLNSMGYFFVASFAPTLFNVAMIVAGFTVCPILKYLGYQSITGMAFGVLIGGLLQMGIQYRALKNLGFRFKFTVNFRHPGFLKILKLMLPATIGVAAAQINVFINTWLASQLADGSISYLNYSFRLMQLPIGLFGVAISSVTLPAISAQIATNQRDKLPETILNSLSLVFLLTIPATFGLIFLREPIISLLYEHGRFNHADTVNTGHALVGYSIGLFGYSAVKILAPVFYAFNETKIPVLASITSVICNVALNFALIKNYGYFGLALATSLTMLLNFLILFVFIKLRVKGLSLRKLLKTLLKIALVSVLMGAVLFYLYDGVFVNIKSMFLGFNTLFNIFTLAILIPLGILILFKFGNDLGIEEVNSLSAVLSKKFKKISSLIMKKENGDIL